MLERNWNLWMRDLFIQLKPISIGQLEEKTNQMISNLFQPSDNFFTNHLYNTSSPIRALRALENYCTEEDLNFKKRIISTIYKGVVSEKYGSYMGTKMTETNLTINLSKKTQTKIRNAPKSVFAKSREIALKMVHR